MGQIGDWIDWLNANRVMALCAVLTLVGFGFLTVKQLRSSNRAADIALKAYEAENLPNIVVESKIRSSFPGYGILDEGVHHALDAPNAFVEPSLVLHTTAKNKGKVPVIVTDAGIRLARTGHFIGFPNAEHDTSTNLQRPPYELIGGRSLDIVVSLGEARRMLKVLEARAGDSIHIEIKSAAGDCFASTPTSAMDLLDSEKSFLVAIQHDPQVTIGPLSDEEYFPEGFFPSKPPRSNS
jgi:hypothetical protein